MPTAGKAAFCNNPTVPRCNAVDAAAASFARTASGIRGKRADNFSLGVDGIATFAGE